MSLNKTHSFYQHLACFASRRRVAAAFYTPRPATTLLSRNTVQVQVQPIQNEKQFSSAVLLKFHATTMSQGDRESMDLFYDDLLEAQKDSSVLIIDVREQSEIDETGKLPGSIHVPMGDVANALANLSEEDFREKYGKGKPSKDTKIILSCRSGRRSAVVRETVQKLGYDKSYNYRGGWLDWEKRQET